MTSPTIPGQRAAVDVVIVGGRCAGAATAHLLARAGLQVVVIERAERGTDTLSTHALMRSGVLQLHRWGVLPSVQASGTPAIHRTVFRYGTAETTVTLKPVGGVDALYAPRRTVLDPILVDAALDAGATFRFGDRATGLTWDGTCRVTGVTGTTRRGEPFTVAAPLVIGADGRTSSVARWTGAEVTRQAVHAGAVLYVDVPGLTSDTYEWLYGDRRAAGVIPTNDGASCVFVGAPAAPSGDRPGTPAEWFHGWLDAVSPELAERVHAVGPVTGLRGYRGTPAYLRRAHGPGWALVGDAGAFTDPIGAHGISCALRDAELLARAVTGAPEGPALDEALASFEERRDQLSTPLLDITAAIASYRWDTTTIEPLLRRLAATSADEVTHLLSLDDTDPAPVGAIGAR